MPVPSDADAVSPRTPRHPSGPKMTFDFVADVAGMEAARAQAASAVGTKPREQLSWLLERFLSADLALRRRDRRLGELFLQLSSLVEHGTRGAWLPDPLPRTTETVPVRHTDRALWHQLPARQRVELERARQARQSTARLSRPDDASLYRLLVEAQASVYGVINSNWTWLGGASRDFGGAGRGAGAHRRHAGQDRNPADWGVSEIDISAKVTVALYQHAPGRLEFRTTSVARLPEAAIVATMALLSQVQESLLRACPYEESEKSSPPHFFLGVKSQKWCSRHRDIVRRDQLRAAQDRHRKSTPSPVTTRMKGKPR
jgi:hypothetical protein